MKLFQPEKDPGEQARAFSPPSAPISLEGLLQPRTFTHSRSCLGNNRAPLAVSIPDDASVYLLNSIKWKQKKSACNYSYGTRPS